MSVQPKPGRPALTKKQKYIMSEPTAARPLSRKDAHWYSITGEARHEIPKVGGNGLKKPTLADARKLNLVPSVTNILRTLHKEALVNWMIEQAALAVLTSPRKEGEELDAFVFRILHTEEVQNEEAKIARDKGTEIHGAFEDYYSGRTVSDELLAWIRPVVDKLASYGEVAASEVILVGQGYAGKTDLIQDCKSHWRIWDLKSTKKLPERGAWSEHRLQLSAYAKSYEQKLDRATDERKPIICGNIYLSSIEPGRFVVWEHEDWEGTYQNGFRPLVAHWQWANGYAPDQPKPAPVKVTAPPALEEPPVDTEPAAPEQNTAPPVQNPRPTVQNAPAPVQTAGLPTVKDGKKIRWTAGIPTAPR